MSDTRGLDRNGPADTAHDHAADAAPDHIDDSHYERLLAARTGLRRFLRWSEELARGVGLTPAQHQLLVAVRGHGDPRGPTIGDVADALLLRHHSAVGLVQRAEASGLVHPISDVEDRRVVRLHLTERGRTALALLGQQSVEELQLLATVVRPMLEGLPLRLQHHGRPVA